MASVTIQEGDHPLSSRLSLKHKRKRTSSSESPSRSATLSYGLRKIAAFFNLNLSAIERSSDSSSDSQTSFTSRSNNTDFTDVTDAESYRRVGELYVLNERCSEAQDYSWTQEQRDLLELVKTKIYPLLGSGNMIMIETRLVARTLPHFQPSIYISTGSRKTIFALRSYLIKGPKFISLLPTYRMNLHIVLDDIVPSCGINLRDNATEMESRCSASPSNSQIARLVLTNPLTGEEATCIAGGNLLLAKETVSITSAHTISFLSGDQGWRYHMVEPEGSQHQEESICSVSIFWNEINAGMLMTTMIAADKSITTCISKVDVSPTAGPFEAELPSLPSVYNSEETRLESTVDYPYQDNAISEMSMNEEYHRPLDSSSIKINDHKTNVELFAIEQIGEADVLLLEGSNLLRNTDSTESANYIGGYHIRTFSNVCSLSTAEVLIALPEGEIQGQLHPRLIFYRVGLHEFPVHAITLDQPLKRGCSGAWVVSQERLCGVIIAINENAPEAFLMPIDYIVENIEKRTGKSVSLPTCPQSQPIDAGITIDRPTSPILLNLGHHFEEASKQPTIAPRVGSGTPRTSETLSGEILGIVAGDENLWQQQHQDDYVSNVDGAFKILTRDEVVEGHGALGTESQDVSPRSEDAFLFPQQDSCQLRPLDPDQCTDGSTHSILDSLRYTQTDDRFSYVRAPISQSNSHRSYSNTAISQSSVH